MILRIETFHVVEKYGSIRYRTLSQPLQLLSRHTLSFFFYRDRISLFVNITLLSYPLDDQNVLTVHVNHASVCCMAVHASRPGIRDRTVLNARTRSSMLFRFKCEPGKLTI